ncbi:hypothetical protein K435DRAFT_788757 [Dendrothele bispora CBS 962.96]|uniref:Uncharacterized protein n=1 Tax=Dendrothele bispora (strain CBS 962.96) TaxID=1314807 RepID=A0A4S8MVN5_DENBC|nr:hypothetical protein K435DRAFT_788757 [Dendrothele bispora CBS 962.96]
MLDSSPVALPNVPRRPLKRSASTASLPTPPRTQHRRKKNGRRSRSTKLSDEDSDGDSPENRSTDEEDNAPRGNTKRRRISDVQEVDDEDSFWTGAQTQANKTQPGISPSDSARSKTLSASSTIPEEEDDEQVPFLFRRKMNQSTTGVAPVSPPPSNRRRPAAKVAVAVIPPAIEEETQASPAVTVASTPPTTPKAQISKGAFMRDSPNNPFLSSPVDDDELDPVQSSSSPSQQEKETMTFVFRGVRKTFPNPYYDREKKRAKSPDPNSLLSPEHEDYSPDLRGAPRVLWPRRKKAALTRTDPTSPTAAAGKRKKAAGRSKARTLLDSDDESEGHHSDDGPKPMKPKRLFDAPKIL